jgi:shikimate dehydrogenase
MISGRTEIIAHLGYPTESFTAPIIYNPWFAHRGIDAVVVPIGARAEHYTPRFCGRCFRSATSAAATTPRRGARFRGETAGV